MSGAYQNIMNVTPDEVVFNGVSVVLRDSSRARGATAEGLLRDTKAAANSQFVPCEIHFLLEMARNKRKGFFTVVFYGLKSFCCKTAQFYETLCQPLTSKTPSMRDGVQHCENGCKH
jgi:hypothetical protein